MYKYLIILLVLLFSTQGNSQSYNTALGLRLGNDLGFTLQQRVAKKTTLQALFYGGNSNPDTYANLLVQQHLPLFSKRFNAFVGLGFGSFWQFEEDNFTQQKYTVPGVIGVEASFGRLNLSGDVMPHLIINSENEKTYRSIANVSLRLILVKRKSKAGENLKDKWQEKFPNKDSKKKKKKKN